MTNLSLKISCLGFFATWIRIQQTQNECESMQIRIDVPYTGSKLKNPNQNSDPGFKLKNFFHKAEPNSTKNTNPQP
jgi:hypothetical protein